MRNRDDESATNPTTPSQTLATPKSARVGPEIRSASQLAAFAKTADNEIYWAGPRPATRYELTQLSDGRVYVRYLPSGVAAGSKRALLTIATYPFVNAFAATLKSSTEPNTVRVDTGAGAVAFYRSGFEKNVYVAFDGSDVQIEVFGPVAGRPASLVSSGQIVAVG